MLDDLSDLFVADAGASAAINRFNATSRPFSDKLVDSLILEAALPPERPCCIDGDLVLDRATFLARAEALAAWLQTQGIGRGSIVGIVMEPSPARIMALFAAMRAGGVALPIDHALPNDRIGLYLKDSQCSVLLIDPAQQQRPWVSAPPVHLVLPANGDAALPDCAVVSDPARHPADWCYVVYTSGTTGKPKAAINNHRALANRLEWMAQDIAITQDDRICHKTPFGFDVSVWEQLLPLLTGACVHIAPDSLRRDPEALHAFFAQQHISISHFVPSQLGEFVDAGPGHAPPGLRCIVASGEALPATTARRVLDWSGPALHNYYGPSEAAIDVTGWSVTPDLGHDVAIGRPIQNGTIRILDSHLAEVPIGAAGEIYIGGVPVGNGYLGAPRISAERFVPDPYAAEPGAMLYRTGDVGHWGDEGMVWFHGRNDRQLKLRGLRIEPGEIESRMVQATGFNQCLVEPVETASGQTVLIGFVVAAQPVDEDEVARRLAQTLPSYMIPSRVITLERLPVSANGKADTKALRAAAELALHNQEIAAVPLDGPGSLLAEIWSTLLRIPVTSGKAHFFKLGGDSITAIRLVARIRAAGFKIETQDVFDRPVLEQLAAAMIPIDLADLPLTRMATALRRAAPSQRLACLPRLVIASSAHKDDILARARELAAALRPDLPVQDAFDPGDCAGAPAAQRLAARPDLAIAADLLDDDAIGFAFDPSCVDQASLQPIADWLTGRGALPRIERQPLADPELSLPPDRAMIWPQGPGYTAWLELPGAPDLWQASASHERYVDWFTAELLAAALDHVPEGRLAAWLPESRTATSGAGLAPDRPVGRLGASRFWCDGQAPGAALVARLRAGPAPAELSQIATPEAANGAIIRFHVSPMSADLHRDWMVAPCLARAEIAVLLHPAGVAIKATEDHAGWLSAMIDTLGQRLRPVPPEWLVQRLPQDFPLARLAQPQLDELVQDYGPIGDIYPLAPLQEGMLMRAAYWPESDAYLNQNIIELRGPLDPVHVAAAWQAVCQRYEILRSGYRWHDLPRPQAIVAEHVVGAVEQLDWTDCPAAGFEQRLLSFLDQDRAVPFDLSQPGLWRLRLIRRSPDCHVLVWTHHHILLDGWCLALIWGDFAKAFAEAARGSASAGQELSLSQPRPYRDYIAWLAAHPPGEATQAYWRQQLDGAQACAFSAGAVDEEGLAATLRVPLPPARKQALDRACADLGLTANAFIQASWSMLLALRLGSTDITHGVSISGRPPEMAGSEGMVGLFINLIPLRVRAHPRLLARDFLKQVQDGLAAANRHGALALPEILSHWQGRATPDQRLFDSLIAFENYPDENLPTSTVAGVEFVDRFCDEKTEYPIGLIVLPGEPFEVHFNYDTQHFSTADIASIRDDYLTILDRFIDHPDSTLATFALSGTPRPDDAALLPLPQPVDVAQLLEAKTEFDGMTALIDHDRSYSRFELRQLTQVAAARLLDQQPGPVMAICMHRSARFAIAVLAAWRAGIVPLIINPAIPHATILTLLADSDADLLVVDDQTSALRAAHRGGVLHVADLLADWQDAGNAELLGTRTANAAAILLTSGTTGTPKQVIIPMAGFAHRIAWTRDLYAQRQPRLLANAAPGFDIGLWELAWPLACGGCVVIADDEDVQDMRRLHHQVSAHGVTALHATPTFASALCERDEVWQQMSLVVTGGELVTADRVRQLARKMPGARIFQGYGPTEASISVIDGRVDRNPGNGPMALGQAMPGCTIRVLDAALRPCPPDVTGTIHIAGLPLSAGYLGAPRQTASAFRPDPYGPAGSLLYDTGDRGYRSGDGLIHFSGRDDRQVKVRGFRVELDAVEQVLGDHPLVRQAAVVSIVSGSETRLHAFAVTADFAGGEGLTEQTLHGWLNRQLPRWAVPQQITVLAALPVSSNGKIDYAELAKRAQEPAGRRTALRVMEPANSLERAIMACWEDVVGAPPETRTTNFFEAGGHSMTAMRLVSQLQSRLELDAEIRVPLFFKFPSVAGFAEALLTDADTGCARHMSCLAEGQGPPLILIHPVEGLCHAYHALARALPGCTVWAIENPRFGTADPFGTLHDMAQLYVEWVRNHFDGQPVVLGGWSFGGAVALEMAAIMARHDRVPGVILIDSYNFAGYGTDPLSLCGAAVDRLETLPGIDAATRNALRNEIVGNTCLAMGSAFQHFPHAVTLLQAGMQDPALIAELGSDNGWDRACPQLQKVVLDGDHYGLMQEPGLALTALAVRAQLAQYDQTTVEPA